jgi:NAD(P)H-nitrite reductase large subunit
MSWLEKGGNETVCYCKNVDKMKILSAITLQGAKTLDEIKRLTGAGTGGDCKNTHPEGRCCHSDIQEILNLYVPVFEDMQKGHGSCEGDCSSCNGCD